MSATDIILSNQAPGDRELQLLAQEAARHPYFHASALTLTYAFYRRHDSSYGDVLQSTAISTPDRTALFALIEGSGYQLGSTSGAAARRPAADGTADRTTSLIDHFLGSLPEECSRRMTSADAANDYMSYLLQSETGVPDSGDHCAMRGQSLIDGFIDSNAQGERMDIERADVAAPSPLPPAESPSADSDDDVLSPEYFTETMARIYIKQGKFEKASKIICRLNAKYPKKNRYFADQLRFLEKLMLNQRVAKGGAGCQ